MPDYCRHHRRVIVQPDAANDQPGATDQPDQWQIDQRNHTRSYYPRLTMGLKVCC
jgi:hypothetical protein